MKYYKHKTMTEYYRVYPDGNWEFMYERDTKYDWSWRPPVCIFNDRREKWGDITRENVVEITKEELFLALL